MTTVYLNGEWLDAENARISPRDRGFRFGDGVFETIPFYGATLFQSEFHLTRLQNGLDALRIPPPPLDWLALSAELIARNGQRDGFIRIAISRGEGSIGYRPQAGIAPTVFIETLHRAANTPHAPDAFTLFLSSWRKPSPRSLPPYKLAAQGVTSTLALLDAQDHDCNEALLLDAAGNLCEAASGNIFWVHNNQLFTPTLSTGCLEGATRHALLKLIATQQVAEPLETLQSAQAVFVTNCNWGIQPVSRLLPQGWQWNISHPLLAECQKAYQDAIHASI